MTTARQDKDLSPMPDSGSGASLRTSRTVPMLPAEVVEASKDDSSLLAQYILVRKLGQGGSGSVHAAWDRKLGRWAAIKVLNQITEENAAKFLREAQLASRLSHPNIVPLFEASEADNGRPFLAMKLVSGRPLSKVQLDGKTACAVMRDVADAVQYAHDNGVIHRDLKPQNLMLDDANHVWIMDFGIAHSLGDGSTLTAVGSVVGTPAFMPPEQARGLHCDERSDVYSLGATLYTLLSGRLPFEGDNALWVMTQVLADDPPALRSLNDRVARDIETIVHKAMRRDPAARYARAREFADDLRRFERGEVVTARPLGPLARLGKKIRRNVLATVIVASVALGVIGFGLGALRYASDMRVREQATAEARALAERRLKEAQKNLSIAEHNRAVSMVEEGNALGASGQWQAAGSRYQAASTLFAGIGSEDPGPNAGMTDVLMHAPPPVWSEPSFHGDRITELLLSPDEKTAYSCSLDGTVKVFDPRTRHLKHTFELGAGVWSIALDRKGEKLAAAVHDGRVVIWDLHNNRELATFRQLKSRVRAVTFSPDAKRMTAGHGNGTCSTWDIASGKMLTTWNEPGAQVRAIAYRNERDEVVVGLSYPRTGPWMTVREGRTGRLIMALSDKAAPSGIRNLGVDEATGNVYAGFDGGFMLQTGKQGAFHALPAHGTATVSLTPAASQLVLSFPTGAMQVRDLREPDRLLFSVRQDAGLLARPGRHSRVWSADGQGGIKLWSVAAQPLMGRLVSEPGVIGVRMVMDGAAVVVEKTGGVFVALDRGTGKQLWKAQLPVVTASYSSTSPQGDLLATADQNGFLAVYSLPDGQQQFAIKNEQSARFLRFSPNGQWLGGTFDHGGAIWDAKTGALTKEVKGSRPHRLMTWLPDGQHVVMAQNNEIVAFNVAKMAVTKSFALAPDWLTTDGFLDSKTGTLLVAFQNRGVVSYDWKTGASQFEVVTNHGITQVAMASDANVLWLGEGNTEGEIVVSVWDIGKHRRVHTFASGSTRVVEPHLPQAVPLAASLTASNDVVIWDLTLPARFAKASDDFELASKRADSPSAPTHLAQARYYALRGLFDWAAEEFDKFAATAGALRAEVSSLEYGRALWLSGRLDHALVQYRLALQKGEAGARYLQLCIAAMQREAKASAP